MAKRIEVSKRWMIENYGNVVLHSNGSYMESFDFTIIADMNENHPNKIVSGSIENLIRRGYINFVSIQSEDKFGDHVTHFWAEDENHPFILNKRK
jgi:hypothetical protein